MQKTNWTTEFKQAFRTLPDLAQFLDLPMAPDLLVVAEKYPIFVPRSLAEKIKRQGFDGVLAREFLPVAEELKPGGLEDPIGDERFHVAPQLIHRYPSRALFAPTTVCPVHCRYCFRKNELYGKNDLFAADFEKTLSYLRGHPEISEIIFTGGDPFSLSDEKIRFFLDGFSKVPSLKDLRFHTRYPVIMPSRFDESLLSILKQATKNFRTVSLAIHGNHVSEFDAESVQTIRNLSQTGLQLLSQTVLLKAVNDDVKVLFELYDLFISLKVRPYYLHHPDQVKGGMHFYVPLETGREIYRQLRSSLPGWGIPEYIIDLPGGEGKTPALGEFVTLQGRPFHFTEPVPTSF